MALQQPRTQAFFFVKGILYLIQCCIYRSAPKFASGASWGVRDEKGEALRARKLWYSTLN